MIFMQNALWEIRQVDELDRQIIALLRVNARLPLARLAQALGIARSTAQLRLSALEASGAISGYTVSLGSPEREKGIRAIVMIAVESNHEIEIIRELTKRHEITRIYTVSGRYDICVVLDTESTSDLDELLNRIRRISGVSETFSNVLLTTKLDRPG